MMFLYPFGWRCCNNLLTSHHVSALLYYMSGQQFDNPERGTVQLTPELLEFCLSRRVCEVFTNVLGSNWKPYTDKKACILLTAGAGYRGTTWHQEIHTLPERPVSIWISLDDGAGDTCPGLSFLKMTRTGIIDELQRDWREEEDAKEAFVANIPQAHPVLYAGDGVVIHPLAPHRTYIPDGLTNVDVRRALKLTAVPA